MNPRITKKQKAAWIKALLSGKYKQGKGTLRKLNEATCTMQYCCLGVACEIGIMKSRYVDSVLPIVGPLDTNEYLDLAELNDGEAPLSTKSRSFKQIAEYIKKNIAAKGES